jgi:hypothetical protein
VQGDFIERSQFEQSGGPTVSIVLDSVQARRLAAEGDN